MNKNIINLPHKVTDKYVYCINHFCDLHYYTPEEYYKKKTEHNKIEKYINILNYIKLNEMHKT